MPGRQCSRQVCLGGTRVVFNMCSGKGFANPVSLGRQMFSLQFRAAVATVASHRPTLRASASVRSEPQPED